MACVYLSPLKVIGPVLVLLAWYAVHSDRRYVAVLVELARAPKRARARRQGSGGAR